MPWWWIPAVGALIGLAEIFGMVASDSLTSLVDVNPAAVFIGTWIRAAGVVIALIAGVVAIARKEAAPHRC